MTIINFTNQNSIMLEKGYSGDNGNKRCIKYNNKYYMLKFPYIDNERVGVYHNSIYCEYIGSKIFKMLGLNTQDVLIGKTSLYGNEKVCVACEDETFGDYEMQEFAKIKNKEVNSASRGYNSDLYEILDVLSKQKNMDIKELKSFFWKMFVIDAFIGNNDRHNGNWGFLYNKKDNTMKLAPVYDNEECLITTISENYLDKINIHGYDYLNDYISSSSSAISINKESINYMNFICACENKDCNNAILEIVPKINMTEINKMIDDIDGLTFEIKELFKNLLLKRKELILDVAYKKLSINKENIQNETITIPKVYYEQLVNIKNTIESNLKKNNFER